MAAPSAAAVWVDVLPSMRGFGPALRRDAGTQGTAAGKKFGGTFSSAASSPIKKLAATASAAFAGAKVASFFKDAVMGASDLGETTSKVGQLFGPAAKDIERFAANAATALGQTRQQAMDANATFGIFGKSAGLQGKALTGFTTELTTLASDLASFNNTSPEEAINAIGSALRGEAEPMRSYGVLLDDATMRQEAMRQGLIKTTKEALTPAQKVLAAQALIMAKTGDAQGDFQRTSGGLANQQRILAARFADFRTGLGEMFLPTITKVMTYLAGPAMEALRSVSGVVTGKVVPGIKGLFSLFVKGDFTKEFRQAFNVEEDAPIVDTLFRIREAIVGTIDRAKAAFQGMAGFVRDNINVIVPLVAAVGTFIGVLKTTMAITAAYKAIQQAYAFWTYSQAASTGVLTAAMNALKTAFLTNPIGIVIAALAALGVGLFFAYKKSERFRAIVDKAWAGVKAAAASAWDYIKPTLDALWQKVKDVGAWFMRMWTDYVQPALAAIGSFITTVWNSVIKPVFAFYVAYVKTVGRVMGWLWNNVVKPVFGFIGGLISVWWNSIVKPIFGIFMATIRVVAKVLGWLWNNIVKPVFKFIGALISVWWNSWVKPIFGIFMAGLRVLGKVIGWLWTNVVKPNLTFIAELFRWLWQNAVKPAFDGMKIVINAVWNYGIKPIFERIKKGVGVLGDAFGRAKDAIGRAWEGLKAKVAGPIQFVIDTVYNNGIRKVWNAVIDRFGGTPLNAISFNPNADTNSYGASSDGRGARRTFAKGGFAAPGWALVGEEGPELVNFTQPGRVYTARQTADMFGAAGGAGDWMRGAGNWAEGRLRDMGEVARGGLRTAAETLLRPVRDLINGIGGTGWAQAAKGLPNKAIDLMLSFLGVEDGKIPTGGTAPAVGRNGWSFPLPRGAYSVGVPINGYPGHTGQDFPAAIGTPVYAPFPGYFNPVNLGNRSYGQYANLVAGGMRFIGAHLSAFTRGAGMVNAGEMIGRVGSSGNSTGPHLHAEFRDNGRVIDPRQLLTFDNGGFLPPGLSLNYNGTGGPEPVLTKQQWKTLSTDRGVNITQHIHGEQLSSQEMAMEAARRTAFALRGGR